MGSLVTALASYLDAKSHRGNWLIRIEDIDPPRAQAGAAVKIIETLKIHGMVSDEPILYQSNRTQAYLDTIKQLQTQNIVYKCSCSRYKLRNYSIYPGTCRKNLTKNSKTALRLMVSKAKVYFDDLIQGYQSWEIHTQVGDFIIRRKDNLFAYQLAVTVDDAFQGITNIVRGSDLLDSTVYQIYLQQKTGTKTPKYAHIPILVDQQEQKLSKQNNAISIDNSCPELNLWQSLFSLKQNPPQALRFTSIDNILQWGINNWSLARISNSK